LLLDPYLDQAPWAHKATTIERKRRGVLMELWRGDGIELQGFECHGAQDLVEMGGKQRIEYVP
jgi:hypothetical protein